MKLNFKAAQGIKAAFGSSVSPCRKAAMLCGQQHGTIIFSGPTHLHFWVVGFWVIGRGWKGEILYKEKRKG